VRRRFHAQSRGPGTTLARFDDALRPVVELRLLHTHPEVGTSLPPPIRPQHLRNINGDLKTAIGNLDSETLSIQSRKEERALNAIYIGLARIEKDGLPNSAALRPRDLHYAGYHREIQFGRLAKATGLYGNFGKSPDMRQNDVNSCISDADNLAHKFHAMRRGPDKSILPASIVAPGRDNRAPGRSLSEVMRELRDERQKPAERLAELEMADRTRAREEHRDAIKELAQTYARMTGDEKAGAAVHKYMQGRGAGLDRDAIDGLRQGLEIAASAPSQYRDLPKTIQDRCVDMCLALFEEQGDSRLLDIVDAAERSGEIDKRETMYDRFPGLTVDEGEEPDLGLDPDLERGPRRR
jgi:hypothetical protein